MSSTPLGRTSPLVRVGTTYVPADEIVALFEIADLIGVTKRTAQRYMDRDDFPEPLGRLAGGRRVWKRSDVEAWVKRTLPLREGRPPKEGN